MIVVGGVYEERVTVPTHVDLAGSGLRAASALGSGTVQLVTALDSINRMVGTSAAAALGVTISAVERDQPVSFDYFTPVSPPRVNGLTAVHPEPMTADDDTVLAFGTIEAGRRQIRAGHLVLDPQQPKNLVSLDLTGLTFDRLTVIGNAREIRALSGGLRDLAAASQKVGTDLGADTVIVKNAARGCLVLDRLGDHAPAVVGPYPTRTVWPLGSGDIFAAGYAYAADRGADPVGSARIGSASAAWWCATRQTVVPTSVLDGRDLCEILPSAGAELRIPPEAPTVYLAAPFFTLADRWLVETCRDVLHGLGMRVFSPLHDVGSGGDEVAAADLDGLRRCGAVLTLLDGWDAGTVYEAGWAHRHGLPVVGFLRDAHREGTKMLVGSGALLYEDLTSALYNVAWAAQGHPIFGSRVNS